MFEPVYPMQFRESDTKNGHVNCDGTVKFGTSVIVLEGTKDEYETTIIHLDKNPCDIIHDVESNVRPMVRFILNGEHIGFFDYKEHSMTGDECGIIFTRATIQNGEIREEEIYIGKDDAESPVYFDFTVDTYNVASAN